MVSHDGEHYSTNRFRLGVRLTERRPKLVLGALNERMLHLAGELADGVLLNYLPAISGAVVRRTGPCRARPPPDAPVVAAPSTPTCTSGCVTPDRPSEPARKDLFSYAVVPAYARAFERAGFGEEVAAITEAHGTPGP